MQPGRRISALGPSAVAPSVDRPLVIAHRGASSIAPENTLLAFRLAMEAGADMIETDVHLTRDGVAVLIHDADLARTTDCSGLVSEIEHVDLAACDAGYWFAPPGRMKHPYRGLKIAVPALADLLALVDGTNDRVRVNLEIKTNGSPTIDQRCVDTVMDVVVANGWCERVLLSSFDTRVIDLLGRRYRAVGTAYLVARECDLLPAIAAAAARGHSAIHPDHRLLGSGDTAAGIVDAMHAAGLRVHVWTVNDPDRMRDLVAAGVDGIVSDDPERLRLVVDEG